jgi:hypothetical protein
MSARSLERVKADALRVLEPLRSKYSAWMLANAVDHILLHDPGHGRCVVPLTDLSGELRACVCVCATLLQGEMNRVQGADNPVRFVRLRP